MAKVEIAEVRRRLAAAPERVFAAFADPALVAQWLRPAPEITLTVLTFDFRVGGAYRFSYGVPGNAAVILGGVFRQSRRRRRSRSRGSSNRRTNMRGWSWKSSWRSRGLARAANW